MIVLLLTMLERVTIIVTVAFLATRLPLLRNLLHEKHLSYRQLFLIILFFGCFGIIGTYSGVSLNIESQQFNRWITNLDESEAIVNSRSIAIIVAGLLGGVRVGFGAGLIAGFHRFLLGGFTNVACGIAAVLAGIIAGLFHKKGKQTGWKMAFWVSIITESLQMGLILFIAKPFSMSLELVSQIGIPMITANSFGVLLFLLVLKSIFTEEEKQGALQAKKALFIAEETLPIIRGGLTEHTAKEVCIVLLKNFQCSAVSITNTTHTLAHMGLGANHHIAQAPIQTAATKHVLQTKQLYVATYADIACSEPNCLLRSAIIAPLFKDGELFGTIKFYFTSEQDITNSMIEISRGLANILSLQLEIGEREQLVQLKKEAEIQLLHSQMNPHFLFNTLNTAISLIRIDPSAARRILHDLSRFIRSTMKHTQKLSHTLHEELQHIHSYLSIEQIRFLNRLHVSYDVDEHILNEKVPSFTLQPIVENAIRHGFKNKKEDCRIHIEIKQIDSPFLRCIVTDNGTGISKEQLLHLGQQRVTSAHNGNGIALYNINQRLIMMYGTASQLVFTTTENGTVVSFQLPMQFDEQKRKEVSKEIYTSHISS